MCSARNYAFRSDFHKEHEKWPFSLFDWSEAEKIIINANMPWNNVQISHFDIQNGKNQLILFQDIELKFNALIGWQMLFQFNFFFTF